MTDEKIKQAMYEARRFINAAEGFLLVKEHEPKWLHPKESGALRRASLDLTRSLAEMRKSKQ